MARIKSRNHTISYQQTASTQYHHLKSLITIFTNSTNQLMASKTKSSLVLHSQLNQYPQLLKDSCVFQDRLTPQLICQLIFHMLCHGLVLQEPQYILYEKIERLLSMQPEDKQQPGHPKNDLTHRLNQPELNVKKESNPKMDIEGDDEDLSQLSISFESDQYNRIYTNELKKNADLKQKQLTHNQRQKHAASLRQQSHEKWKERRRRPRSRSRSQRRRARSQSKSQQKQEFLEPRRSRSREKKSHNWHIYQICQQLEINSKRFPLMIRNLPIFQKKQEILHQILHNQIVLVTGETGCGKSTQVPRLLYQYIRSKDMAEKIICVQPRRLAVKNLHSILSKQIPEKGAVGYHISMQSFVKDNTKILFMTNGIFLQRLIHSTQFFDEYSFIILDEVHQRDIDTDFILLAMKRIIRKHPRVRIILMSATIDNRLFQYYFAEDEVDTFMKRQNYYKKYIRLEQQYEKERQSLKLEFINPDNEAEEEFDIEIEHYHKEDELIKKVEMEYLNSKYPCPTINVTDKNKYSKKYYYLDTLEHFIKGNNHTKKWGAVYFSHKYPATHKQLYLTVCQLLQEIVSRAGYLTKKRNEPLFENSSILIFLPGLAQIQYLISDIMTHFGRKAQQIFEIVKCHSSILNDETMKKIHYDIRDKCKVIIATNIAESSITVPGVKYVIDFCLSKEINFDQKSRMENLDLVWTSKASCEQRAGRTGRVCDGVVIRLVEKGFYEKLKDYSTPEIQRSSLDRLILRIKLIHENQIGNIFEDPGQVLGTALQPPNLKNIDEAIKSLIFCGGLKLENNKIILTEIGRVYVDIPLDIIYTKLLIFSLLMGTYEDILILVCILSQNKNAFRKSAIEKSPREFFQLMNNDARCDFYALVQAYKSKRKWMQDRQKEPEIPPPKVSLDIYQEAKLLKEDIERRISKKKFLDKLPPTNEIFSQDDFQERFKLTICYGFLGQLMKVKNMIYDDKQQKRAKMMKKQNITINNTIVLLNSDVIRKSSDQNLEVDNRLKKTWVQNIAFNFHINPANLSLTLGYGLSFLHCKKETDLNKILFVKYMQKKQATDERKGNSLHLTISQILPHLGDFDYMEEGVVSDYYKEHTVFIDNFSSNRIVSSGNQNLNSLFSPRLLISNSIMQQSNRLSCRYCSLLPQIPNLDILLHLVYYPFVILLPDQKLTRYQYIYLKKKNKIKIDHQLSDEQIEEVNQIRQTIRKLMSMQLFSDEVIENLHKEIVNIEQIDEDAIEKNDKPLGSQVNDSIINENQIVAEEKQYMELIKQRNQISRDMEGQSGLERHTGNKQGQMEIEGSISRKQQLQNTIKNFWPSLKKFITRERNPVVGQQKWQQIYFREMKIDNKSTFNRHQKIQEREYMNQIKTLSLKFSYFSKYFISNIPLQQRINNYQNWKTNKYHEVKELQDKVMCHEPYLICSECLPDTQTKITKLSKIGPLTNQYYRQLFEYSQDNIQKLPYNQLGDYFCSMLMSIYTEKEYDVLGCKNGHYLMIKFKDEKRTKILTFSPVSIMYADGQIETQPEFQNLEVRYWKQKSQRARQRKLKKVQQNYCFICNIMTYSIKQLENHIRSQLHQNTMRQFKLNIKGIKQDRKQNKKSEYQNFAY